MRVLIEAHHPAHIHFFKNAVGQWRKRGDDVLLLGRDRDVMRQLLDHYHQIPSKIISTIGTGSQFPMREMLERQLRISSEIVRFRPDVVLSLMGSYTQSSRLLRVPSAIFTDSEFQHFNHTIAHPFATRIYTPECFYKDLGRKQRRYPGYHELAFLHPDWFTPDPSILGQLGVAAGEYIVVRVSAWDTLHDVGESGFGGAFDEMMEAALRKFQVFVVPERGKMGERWSKHRLSIAPHQFHDVLAFARFVVTEGASTAAEAACLGVPSVYVNTTSRGYLDDMERRYGLVSGHRDSRSALKRVMQWLRTPPDLEAMRRAQQALIAEHIDVTKYVIKEIDEMVAR